MCGFHCSSTADSLIRCQVKYWIIILWYWWSVCVCVCMLQDHFTLCALKVHRYSTKARFTIETYIDSINMFLRHGLEPFIKFMTLQTSKWTFISEKHSQKHSVIWRLLYWSWTCQWFPVGESSPAFKAVMTFPLCQIYIAVVICCGRVQCHLFSAGYSKGKGMHSSTEYEQRLELFNANKLVRVLKCYCRKNEWETGARPIKCLIWAYAPRHDQSREQRTYPHFA